MVRRLRAAPALLSSRPLLQMAWLGALILFVALLFGGLPRSSEVRRREARSELVSSGRRDLVPTTTTSTTVPDIADPRAVSEALEAAGFPGVDVMGDGSSIVLGGTVPDEASRRVVVAVASAVPGVGTVVDRTTVEAVPVAGDVTIEATERTVRISGRVPDRPTADAVLDAIRSVYPSEQVEGTVEVEPTTIGPVRITGRVEATRAEVPDLLMAALAAIEPTLATSEVEVERTPRSRVETELAEVLAISTIGFASGSAVIDRESQFTLDVIAAVLSEFPEAALEVGGHTDDVGDATGNLALSRDRAVAVVDALRERSVENDLEPVGYGELRPRSDSADRAANRRIEFSLILP